MALFTQNEAEDIIFGPDGQFTSESAYGGEPIAVNQSEPYSGQSSGNVLGDITRLGWDALAIYGQKQAIDAQFASTPPPQDSTPQVQTSNGPRDGGQVFNGIQLPSMNNLLLLAVLGGAALLIFNSPD